jgi:TolB-like protein
MDTKTLTAQLKEHSILKTAFVYVLVSWVALQVIDIIFPILDITQYYQQWALYIMVLGLPIAILYSWANAFGANTKNLKRKRIVAFSMSALLAFGGLFSGFSILGSPTTRTVRIVDAEGVAETFKVLKTDLVKRVVIFPFENKTGITNLDWVGEGLSMSMSDDLEQFTYLNTFSRSENLVLNKKVEKVQNLNADYYVDGSFTGEPGNLQVEMNLHTSNSIDIIQTAKQNVRKVVEAGDSMSLTLREWMNIDPVIMKRELDFPVSEILTTSDSAFKYYLLNQYEKAVELDSTFASAALVVASRSYRFQLSEQKTSTYLDLAMAHKDRFPKQIQSMLLSMYYFIKDEREKVMITLDNSLKLRPNYQKTLDFKAAILSIWRDERLPEVLEQIAKGRLLTTYEKFSEIRVLAFTSRLPEAIEKMRILGDETGQEGPYHLNMGILYFQNGDLEEAKESFSLFQLTNPDEPYIVKMLDAIEYYNAHSEKHISDILLKMESRTKSMGTNLEIVAKKVDLVLFEGAVNQGSPDPYFLLNDSTVCFYSWYGRQYFEDRYTWNEAGYLTSQLFYQVNQPNTENEEDYYYLVWSKESLIDSAKSALVKGDYSAANELYDLSFKKHPEHFYLKQYQDHIDFQANELWKADRLAFESILGEYESRSGTKYRFFQSNGRYYRSAFNGDKELILPMSKNGFKTISDDSRYYELERTGSVVKGIKSYKINPHTKKYESEEDNCIVRVEEPEN